MTPQIYRGLEIFNWPHGFIRGWAWEHVPTYPYSGVEYRTRKVSLTPLSRLEHGRTVKQVVDRWWGQAKVAYAGRHSVDGVPWELHAIENRAARWRAYSAWSREHDHVSGVSLGSLLGR